MASNQQLVPCDPTAVSANNVMVSGTPTSQSRIRTNIVLLKPLSFYVPDNDDSVPYAFMLGRHTISAAKWYCEDILVSGYFSALCAVLPDLTSIANRVIKNLGFQAEEIPVPSQADRMSIEIPDQSQSLKLEIIKFSQMCFLPFQNTFNSDIKEFWEKVAKDAGVVTDLSTVMMCSVESMKTIITALEFSQLKGELQSSIASALRELAILKSPFGRIISEATKRARSSYTSGTHPSSPFGYSPHSSVSRSNIKLYSL